MIALRYAAILFALLSTTCRAADLNETLDRELPALGHRNWIVIADAAYPVQVGPGIETLYIGGDQLETVAKVLKRIAATKHLRAKVLLDAELTSVPEQDAPGVTQFRDRLGEILKADHPEPVAHEKLIGKLDEAGKMFRVLVIKTDLTIPYTSVFVQLDCGYWSAEAEQRLRKSLPAEKTIAPEATTTRKK